MADYYPLIVKAVAGLEKNTGEGRRILYERARNALVTQLRSVTPALSESDITRERLALEEAIRKVEADAARRARAESAASRAEKAAGKPADRREEGAASPKAPSPDQDKSAGGGEAKRPDEPPAEAGPRPPPRRNQFGEHPSLRDQGLKGFRDVVAEAETLGEATAQASKSAREAFAAAAPTRDAPRIEPHVEPEGLRPPPRRPAPRPPPSLREPPGPRGREGQPPRNGEPPLLREAARGEPASPGGRPGPNERPPPWLPGARRPPPEPGPTQGRREPEPGAPPGGEPEDLDFAPRGPGRPPFRDADEEEAERPFPLRDDEKQPRESLAERLRAVAGFALNRTALIAAAAVALLLVVSGLAYWQWPTIAGLFSSSTVTPAAVEREAAPSSRTKMTDRIGAPARTDARPQEAPSVAQRVVLYEEDPANPAGKRHVGTAVWRLESLPSGPGQAVDVAVRAEIEIPEVKVGVKFSVSRNTDKALPASHTIEIVFTLPPDFPNGGISNIPGILMKQAEQTRGVPLAGLAVKVTTGFFLIGLSSAEADVQRNIALLKERAWFDVPVIYGNGRRAIMAIEKGTPGDRAFAEAFAAWGE